METNLIWNPTGNSRTLVKQHSPNEVLRLLFTPTGKEGTKRSFGTVAAGGSNPVFRKYEVVDPQGKVIFTKNAQSLNFPCIVGDSQVGQGLAGVIRYGVKADSGPYTIICTPVNPDGSPSINRLPSDLLVDVNNVG